jgi:peroxiredoxin
MPLSRPALRSLGFSVTVAALALAFAWAVLPARADDEKDDEKDAPKPELLKDAKAEASTKPAGPTTGPATQPTTKPVIEVSPAIRAELDAVRDAYRGLKSLRLAATVTGEFDINGEQAKNVATVESTFQAPAKFRLVVREGEGKDAAGAAPAAGADDKAAAVKDGLVIGCNGEKLYVYDRLRRQYQTAAAPKERVPLEKLGKPFWLLLAKQDPSLVLALSDDAGREILEGAKSAERGEDVKAGDVACFVINLTGENGARQSFLIDPKTHLLRRVVLDVHNSVPKGAEVKKAELTIDYTDASPDAEVKAEQLAWAAPKGARDVGASPLASITGGGGGDGGAEEAAVAALVGKPAPDFTLKGMDGKDVSLSDLKGHVVILDFWATWCGPCRASLPHLDKIYADHKADGVKAFAVDQREDKATVQKFVEQTKLGMPVLFDEEGQVGDKYGVSGIPQTVVIGKDGNVKKATIGSGQDEVIRKAVEEALK